MKHLKDLAFKSRDNPQDRLDLYVELLEAHIQSQDALLELCHKELDLLLTAFTQEQS
jgi:hypothetical protein